MSRDHQVRIDADGTTSYRGVVITLHNGRWIVVQNKDLLGLGMRTMANIQSGHMGYTTLKKLMDRIDKGMLR